jgi:hypothetical protein
VRSAQQQTYGGLLTKEDQNAARQKALLAMSAQLLSAGGPQQQRVSFGQALGPALLAGQQAQQQGGQDALQALLLKSQIAKRATSTQTNAQKDYEYAKSNGFNGTFEEWKKVAAAQPQTPSAIQEFEYYNKLPSDEERNKYLTVKRSMQPFQLGEVGGGKVVFNRATGQYEQATSAEQEAAGASQIASGKAGGAATGEAVAKAAFDLPRVEQNTNQAVKALKDLRAHKGLGAITGLYSLAPIVPGTDQASADALAKQVEGKTFLEAFNTLKGAGAITETEGTKATSAIGRLQRAQGKEDYQAALDDLVSVLEGGLDRARKTASGGKPSPAKRSREEILKQYGITK